MKKVDFYFDFLSPYSYFAWKNHISLKGKFEFNYIPVLMGQLFNTHGIKGPGEIPAKRYLMLRNCFRYAQRKNIEFVPPAAHPFNPLYVLRLACKSCSLDNQFQVIDLLWKYIWAMGKNADDPDKLEKYLTQQELNGTNLLERISSFQVRSELKSNTKQALNKHLFGVPSFVIDDEVFWGNDSLVEMIEFAKNGIMFDEALFKMRTQDIKI